MAKRTLVERPTTQHVLETDVLMTLDDLRYLVHNTEEVAGTSLVYVGSTSQHPTDRYLFCAKKIVVMEAR